MHARQQSAHWLSDACSSDHQAMHPEQHTMPEQPGMHGKGRHTRTLAHKSKQWCYTAPAPHINTHGPMQGCGKYSGASRAGDAAVGSPSCHSGHCCCCSAAAAAVARRPTSRRQHAHKQQQHASQHRAPTSAQHCASASHACTKQRQAPIAAGTLGAR